jgi:hypothetical protein
MHNHILIDMQELDDFIDDQDDEAVVNPVINWNSIWYHILFSPNDALQFIFLKDKMRHTWLIYLLMTILTGLSQLTNEGFRIESQPTIYRIGVILVTALVLFILYAVMSLSLGYSGRLIFKFKGRFIDFLIIQALSLIPVFISGLLQVTINVLMKMEQPEGINGGGDLALVATIIVGLLRGIGLIWAVVIALAGIKLTQKTALAKSIGNYAIAGLALMIILFGISMMFVYYQSQQTMSNTETNKSQYDEIISRKN